MMAFLLDFGNKMLVIPKLLQNSAHVKTINCVIILGPL